MKNSNEQLDDRVVEVHWDSEHEHWRMMRFRDDKPHGNHKSVVDNIIKSIADGIEKDVVRTLLPFLLSFSPSVSVLAVVTAARPCSDITLPFSFPISPCNQLLSRSASIRNNWKTRAAPGGAPPPPQKSAHAPHGLPPKPVPPPPPPPAAHRPPPDAPRVEQRYARLAPSPWSKVTGPPTVGGMNR